MGTVVASGIVSVNIDCKKEGYTIDGSGNVALPGQGTAGDCIHDALQKYTVDLQSVKYDAGSDSIELSVHKILNIKVKLTKGELEITLVPDAFATAIDQWTQDSVVPVF